ncbi:hypothetical protein BY458DRAFT_555668 [Sporodiniella umbellata]|nr:hypothetical protein BY458DRAFT_555668 [Sporodiniella umbellata]
MNSTLSSYYTHLYGGYRFDNCSRFYSQSAPPDEIFDDDDQIPTVQEFNAIINDYLNNLSPKKRDKALVDQYRYSQIQQVLRDPRNTAISTAQFRFWVKKMFQLQTGASETVCHDNKPVATKEQIYDILVRAHREAHHGGRDKTSALVRRRYSWIPKELVARFVRHCPFCITRRSSGHSPLTKSSSPPRFARHGYSLDSGMPPICIPSLKEESDLSSGPPSSISGYEPSANYNCVSTNSSPRKPYFNSIYDREEPELLDCSYDATLQSNPFSSTVGEYRNDCQQPPGSIHPLINSSHSHAALFYAQNQASQNGYADYPFYNTGYYPTSLNLSPCHENANSPSSNAAAVAVAAASSTAAAAAAAAAVFMRPSTASPVDLLSHHQDQYNPMSSTPDTATSSLQSPNCSTPPSGQFLSYPSNMPEASFQTDI